MSRFLAYCGWCGTVSEVSTDWNACGDCRADSPRAIESLPDAKIAELVEAGELTHDDLLRLEVA